LSQIKVNFGASQHLSENFGVEGVENSIKRLLIKVKITVQRQIIKIAIMKFPSFIKVPNNRQFGINPRYYDPVREQIKERTAYIKSQMDGESNEDFVPRNISFERRAESVSLASMLQLLIAAFLGLIVVGWLFYGNQIFHVLWLIVPLYLFFRIKGKRVSE
jgi:hypothetical protein